MADVEQSQFSLMSLEEELTCSICLSTFDCPVTLPCGHNFCQDCLQAHWKDSYSCPQCRTLFPTKPELKKNTVLSTVVKTFNLRSNNNEDDKEEEEAQEEKKDEIILCDTCMEAEASKTCLTCMASFCEEHLRPHRENPKFSVHQLCELGELSEKICPDHNKLKEFFCSEHQRSICSLCLQQVHKGCPFISPEEQRSQKETDFRDKLGLLETKINKTEMVLVQMKDMQNKLKDTSAIKKTALAGMYRQMQEMLAAEEREAQNEVDREQEVCQKKLQDFMGRFTENAVKMRKASEAINSLLSQSQSLAFLQTSFYLPKVVNFDPYPPRVSLDTKKVTSTQACAAALKDHLTELLKQPAEDRLQTLKPGEKSEPFSGPEKTASAPPEPDPQVQSRPPRSHSPGPPTIKTVFQPVHVPVYIPHPGWDTPPYTPSSGPNRGPHFKPGPKPNMKSDSSHKPPHRHETKPPGASGGGKPSAKGSDSAKKDKPKGHPASGKPFKGNPHPKK
ncbi:E3 ubiquitin/ISG15 ligase TRIM25-like isoform X2 [Halichoeres trimaculatus]